MTIFSTQEAADAVGKSKSTIIRGCKNGKISYQRDLDGNYKIDASELYRVYPDKKGDTVHDTPDETPRTAKDASKVTELEHILETTRLKAERDAAIERAEALKSKMLLITDQTQEKTESLRKLNSEIGDLRHSVERLKDDNFEHRIQKQSLEKDLASEKNKSLWQRIFR